MHKYDNQVQPAIVEKSETKDYSLIQAGSARSVAHEELEIATEQEIERFSTADEACLSVVKAIVKNLQESGKETRELNLDEKRVLESLYTKVKPTNEQIMHFQAIYQTIAAHKRQTLLEQLAQHDSDDERDLDSNHRKLSSLMT